MKVSYKAICYLSNLPTSEVDDKVVAARKLLAVNMVSDAYRIMKMNQADYDQLLSSEITELLS